MQHPWYNAFDWAGQKAQTLQAPYVPKVKGKKDIANFSAREEDMPPQVEIDLKIVVNDPEIAPNMAPICCWIL